MQLKQFFSIKTVQKINTRLDTKFLRQLFMESKTICHFLKLSLQKLNS